MRIVIIGGGFAGIKLAKKLMKKNYCEVIIVDKNNYHFFPPLLYQVSTAFIETYNIAYPFRRMFQRKNNVQYFMGALEQILYKEKKIITSNGDLNYDYLVLSMGAITNYYAIDHIEDYAIPMKNINDAIHLRNHLLLSLEKASQIINLNEIKKYTTIVIAGGGPTGVEIAGMLAEMRKKIIPKDYSIEICKNIEIYIVDMEDALLKSMSKKAQKEAFKVLEAMGIKIKLKTTVKGYENNKVVFKDGESIETVNLIWASGVKSILINGLPDACYAKTNRLIVDEFNELKQVKDVFCIGDQCLQATDKNYPNGHPQLAQVAIQQGNNLAENFIRHLNGEPPKPFHYKNKGSMAIIAKYKAVVDLPHGFFKGVFAWFIWLFIHLIPIAGFRNKIKLFFSWSWSFITNDPPIRLIIRPRRKEKNSEEKHINEQIYQL